MAGQQMVPDQTHQGGGRCQAWRCIHPPRARDHGGGAGRYRPAGNFQLRTAINQARAAGVPASNIDRAIAKGPVQAAMEPNEVRYEGYGPSGMAVMVDALTDNRNRTAADLRLLQQERRQSR